MAARLTRLLSPLRSCSRCASIISPACQPSPMFHRLLISGRHGLLKNWGKWWIQPDSLNALPLTFEFLKRKMFSEGFRLLSGKKLLIGSSVGFTIVNGIINDQSCTIYAWDGQMLHSFVFGFLFPDYHFIDMNLLFARSNVNLDCIKEILVEVPYGLNQRAYSSIILNNNNPDYVTINILQFVYKNVKVEDYKILCLATVEERNTKLHLLGILDGC
ncbi:hypothetical protein Cni_G11681 [Canna indica]|uniref:Uncharacterized protein n=1 Tax=Canna indica TaxID=4628 RepID=A0AAQ3K6H7_9LILI|nr:hypothetical protein Cni_G11681 [Canna indica]